MNTETTQEQSQNEVFSTGVRLRNARKKLGLSQQVVAERLCLKVSTVRDIEEDKIPSDLALTFLRGYIRSYAKLVHIPENELLPVIEKQAQVMVAKMAPIQSFSLKKYHKKQDRWVLIITWLILLILICLTSIWWWQDHKAQQRDITNISNQSLIELNGKEKGTQNILLNTDNVLFTNKSKNSS